jgi:hypothetical protein
MFVMPIHDPAKPLALCIDEDLELGVQLLHERRDHRRRSATRHPPTAGVV